MLLDALKEKGLTPRQCDVALEMAKGLKNRQIAENLGISINTLQVHVGMIYLKLGFSGNLPRQSFKALVRILCLSI